MVKKCISMVIVLILIVTASGVYASENSNLEYNGLDSAKKIAMRHVELNAYGSLEGWVNASIVDGVFLYDFQDNIVAYGFNVSLNGEIVGYVIVSSDQNNSPIPEFGVGTSLPFLNKEKVDLAYGELSKHGVYNKSKFLYPSTLSYIVEFESVSLGKIEKNYVDLRTNEILQLDSIKMIKELTKNESENNYWKVLENENNINPMNIRVEKILPGIPKYKWRKGCTPTAAAMVMVYWRDKGYSSLSTGNTLIDQLAVAMNTDSDGASPWANIPTGIKQVAKDSGYSKWYVAHESSGKSYSTFSKYKNEINNDRTILAHFIDSSVYQTHSVAGVGFRYDDYQEWLIVHDTWDINSTIYVDYASSVLGTPRWTYVQPAK